MDVWRAILGRVHAARAPVASVYERAVPLEVTPDGVMLGFDPSSFEGTQAADPEALDLLQREVNAHFGAPTKLALDLSAKHLAGYATVASLDAERRRQDVLRARAAVAEHPLVLQAIALFGAELRDVRLPRERDPERD